VFSFFYHDVLNTTAAPPSELEEDIAETFRLYILPFTTTSSFPSQGVFVTEMLSVCDMWNAACSI